MWKKIVTRFTAARKIRQAPASRGALVLKSPKTGTETISVESISASKLRSLLENRACALHFTGSEERLKILLQGLAPEESLRLKDWRVIEGGTDGKVVQVKLTGDREIRRLVRLIDTAL